MPGTTTKYALRYPQAADAPNVATDIQNLATDVDAAMAKGVPTGAVVNGQWIKGSGGSAIWSGITSGDVSGLGPQLPATVNGQWVYGSGGVPTWKAIAQADLPSNIGANTYALNSTGVDLNTLVATGWYNGASLGNCPRGDWVFIFHLQHQNGGNWYTQICYTMQVYPPLVYMRSCTGGTWQPWVNISGYNGHVEGGKLTAVTSGPTRVNFATGYNTTPFVVTTMENADWDTSQNGGSGAPANGTAYPRLIDTTGFYLGHTQGGTRNLLWVATGY